MDEGGRDHEVKEVIRLYEKYFAAELAVPADKPLTAGVFAAWSLSAAIGTGSLRLLGLQAKMEPLCQFYTAGLEIGRYF